MRYIIFLSLTMLLVNCTQEKISDTDIGNKRLLYADYTEDKLLLLDLESLKEFTILDNISEQDHFLFWGSDKILRIPPQGTDAPYFVYDIFKNNWVGRNYKSSDNDVDITRGVCNYNDTLLIIAGTENIYYETPFNDYYNTIKTGFGSLMDMKCNSNGVLAVLYSDSEKVDFINSHNLMFYDLRTQKRVNTEVKPFLLKEWSINGKYLSFYDISDKANVNKILEYPSMRLINDSNSLFGYKYLNDSLIVDIFKEDSSEVMGPSNLFLYNLNSASKIKITNTSTRKALFDVYYR